MCDSLYTQFGSSPMSPLGVVPTQKKIASYKESDPNLAALIQHKLCPLSTIKALQGKRVPLFPSFNNFGALFGE